MNGNYDPNSIDAVLSRIEAKLTTSLATQEEHQKAINRLWSALGRLDVRVTAIAVGISVVAALVKWILIKS